MESDSYTIVSMSPLPESFFRALFAPYTRELDKPLDIIVLEDPGNREAVKEALEKADVVIGDYSFRFRITREICSMMKKVKLIAQPSTGYDHIDVKACAEKGIPVANIGAANAVSVAEYTIMTALALLRRLMKAHNDLSNGLWSQWELMELGTYDLFGKTWGVIGLGRIGREVVKRLRGFDVRILYYDKYRLSRSEEEELGVEYAPFPKLLKLSDVISIHVPLTEETRRMIGERELRLMKPTAILINPSRGEIVDEEALARALKEGWIMGAAVDVYTVEPPGPDHPLIKVKGVNIITTPHIAGATSDARTRIIQVTVENVVRVLKGEKPLNVVNM
ncbi:MAG: 2-hydroxyacid dehydrogenase [Desulfurococcales archaeon]|nr:2-hydroxyacid dehydrogenase [Desulfurococcales archaeon]